MVLKLESELKSGKRARRPHLAARIVSTACYFICCFLGHLVLVSRIAQLRARGKDQALPFKNLHLWRFRSCPKGRRSDSNILLQPAVSVGIFLAPGLAGCSSTGLVARAAPSLVPTLCISAFAAPVQAPSQLYDHPTHLPNLSAAAPQQPWTSVAVLVAENPNHELGTKHAWLVRGVMGLEEISLSHLVQTYLLGGNGPSCTSYSVAVSLWVA